MSLIHNERVKLRANALDRLSTAFLAIGVVGQTLNLAPVAFSTSHFLGMAGWIGGAAILHWIAYRSLGRLEK